MSQRDRETSLCLCSFSLLHRTPLLSGLLSASFAAHTCAQTTRKVAMRSYSPCNKIQLCNCFLRSFVQFGSVGQLNLSLLLCTESAVKFAVRLSCLRACWICICSAELRAHWSSNRRPCKLNGSSQVSFAFGLVHEAYGMSLVIIVVIGAVFSVIFSRRKCAESVLAAAQPSIIARRLIAHAPDR